MANEKISELTEITTPLIGDFIAIVDSVGAATKKLSLSNARKVMEWDQHITKATDFNVVNTTTVQSDSELTFAIANLEAWYIECFLIYSASSATVDGRFNFVLPTAEGNIRGMSLTTANAVQTTGAALVAATATTDITVGSLASVGLKRMAVFEFTIVAGAAGNFTVQIANGTSGVGNTTRLCAGSMIRGKKIL